MARKKTSPPKDLKGLEQSVRLFGEEHVRSRIEKWKQMGSAGDLYKNFSYGGLYARKVLDLKTRQLCTLAALTALNATTQLKSHMEAAFRVGATEAEVKEVLFQTSAYCGIPYMQEAYKVYLALVKERKEKAR